MKKLIWLILIFLACAPRKTIISQEQIRSYIYQNAHILNSLQQSRGSGIIRYSESGKIKMTAKFSFYITKDTIHISVKNPLLGVSKDVEVEKIQRYISEIADNIKIEEAYRTSPERIVAKGFLNGKEVFLTFYEKRLEKIDLKDTVVVLREYREFNKQQIPCYVSLRLPGKEVEFKISKIRRVGYD